MVSVPHCLIFSSLASGENLYHGIVGWGCLHGPRNSEVL